MYHTGVRTAIERQQFLSIVFDLERTNQLSLLPDKDLVDLCPPIEPYQVTKNHFLGNYCLTHPLNNLNF
ncbi:MULTISPECIES: hypothetical protein [unclassified Microcystis]|uniref:hypothetical protein n=1 Tax=unclassified Microcystis TaxID=2643300 RepID=UPI002589CE36|nr:MULTISPECIES: hypothetical protein [unclassified Microcystis]